MSPGGTDSRSIAEMLLALMPWLGLASDDVAVYRLLLTGSPADDAGFGERAGLPPDRVEASLARLAECGFLSDGVVTAPGPALRTLVHRRRAEVQLRRAELERAAGRIEALVSQFVGIVPEAVAGGGSIELITGAEKVGLRANDLMGSARTELLVLNAPPYAQLSTPPYSSEPAVGDTPPASEDVTGRALARGLRVRHVIAHEGIDVPRRMSELAELVELGLEVRVQQRVPTKLIIADRTTALLPPTVVADPGSSAVLLRDGLLMNALIPLFDAVWDTALPLGVAAAGPQGGPSDEERILLGLLASGLKDEAIARQLDVHVHTARRRISALLTRLGADSRFQAGFRAARRGWLE